MLSVESVIGCRLTFEKLLRAELRGELRAKLLRGGAVRAVGQVTAGRAAGYDLAKFAVRADWGPSYCGRAAGQEMTNMRGGAGCGLDCNLRAQISSPRRALIYIYIHIHIYTCVCHT